MPARTTMTTVIALACLPGPATGVAQEQPEPEPDAATTVEARDGGDGAAPETADEAPAADEPAPPPRRNLTDLRRNYLDNYVAPETITGDWWGHGDDLGAIGITLTLDFWAIGQATVRGGTTSADGTTGEYRLAAHFDLERAVNLPGGGVFFRLDGGWDEGPDSLTLGTLLPPDGEFQRSAAAIVTHLWYQQDFFDRKLRIRGGVVDVADGVDFHGHTVAFDGNMYANFGGTQFLNGGLINDGTIPFPDPGIGVLAIGEPVERVYVAAAFTNVTDGLGVREAFEIAPRWMFLAETGVVNIVDGDRLPGAYNLGYWRFSQDAEPAAWGVYVGMDQMLYREGPDDLQGLGMFARYGYGSDSPTLIRDFFSIGAQYRGPFPTRDRDVIALGWAQAFPTPGPLFTASYEGVIEGYYRAAVTPWFSISPMIQYIVDPGAKDVSDAVIVGLRTQFVF